MALYSVDSQQYVDYIPHRDNFERWRSRLPDAQFDAICDELRRMIDGAEIHTAGWMPGSDWTGTPWEPIYTDACDYDVVASGYCFCSSGSCCRSTRRRGDSGGTRRTGFRFAA